MTLKERLFLFFQQNEIQPEVMHGNPEMPEDIHIPVSGENGSWEGIALCYEEERLLVFYVNLGVIVPKKKREKICAWLLEKNYYYKYGGIFIDPSSGTLITRNSIPVFGTSEEQDKLIWQTIYSSVMMADREFLEIMQKVFAEEP